MGKPLPQEEREALWVRPELKRTIRVIAALEGTTMSKVADDMAEAYIATKQVPVSIELPKREEAA